jgi:predicted RNA-binding protein with PUA-like domain
MAQGDSQGYWLVKSDPSAYAWEDLERDGTTVWDGVRNALACRHLSAMKKGDLVLVYHSQEGKEVVGVARVAKEARPDRKADDERLVVVDLAAVKRLARPVSLAEIKGEPALKGMALVRQARLSVMPATKAEFERILALAKTKL